MAGKPVRPSGTLGHRLPFSPGMLAGETLYVSGQVAIDEEGQVVGVGDIAEQTRFVLEAIRAVVEAAGGRLEDVVFNQVFLKDMGHMRGMNRAYREFFASDPPARFCVQAPLALDDLLVEIASVAYLGD